MSPNGQPPPDAALEPVDADAALLVRTFRMEPGRRFADHAHDRHQLAWARSGVLVVTTGSGDWVLPPTRALWIPTGGGIRFRPAKG